jgi:hypothetical protein
MVLVVKAFATLSTALAFGRRGAGCGRPQAASSPTLSSQATPKPSGNHRRGSTRQAQRASVRLLVRPKFR